MRVDIAQLQRLCEEDSRILLCVLFGSEASGTARAGSDIDLGLWPVRGLSGAAKLDVAERLSNACDGDLDVVWLGSDTDPTLAREVLCRGRLMFERNPGFFDDMRSLAARRYMDSEWLFKLRRQQLQWKVRELSDHVS